MFFRKQTNYEKSNSILKVDFKLSKIAKELSSRILRSKSEGDRQELSLDLVDELCDLAKIDIVNVKISEAKQYHKKHKGRVVAKQYGYYRPSSKYIYINNRTAVRGQILAPKSFLDTLLHEWLHHYDFCRLKINSIHTSGFYSRLNDLKQKAGYFE